MAKENPMAKKPVVKRPSAKPAPLGLASKTKPRPLGVAPKGSERKPATPVSMPKKTLRGPDAIKEIQRQVSPKGIKKTELGAKKGLDKKYPGLYKNSKQEITMAYKAPKPTKAQLAEAKVRAAASGIAMNQSAKGLRNASKAIVAGASMLPAGRAVKVAATAAKAATKASSAAKRTKTMADAAKKAEAIKIAKTVAKKPEASVKVVPARGSSYNKVANQKETDRLLRNPMPKSTPKSGRGSARPDDEVAKIKVSDNVTARVPAKSNYEFAKDMSRFGKIQKQNAGPLKPTKAEAKANARGLKAANKKKKK